MNFYLHNSSTVNENQSNLIQLPLLCILRTWLNNWFENGMTPQGAVHCYTNLKLGHREFFSCSEWTLFVVFRSSNKTVVDIDPKIMIQKCFVEINPSVIFYYSYLLRYLLSQQYWMHIGRWSSVLHMETEVCLRCCSSIQRRSMTAKSHSKKDTGLLCKSSICFAILHIS